MMETDKVKHSTNQRNTNRKGKTGRDRQSETQHRDREIQTVAEILPETDMITHVQRRKTEKQRRRN